MTVYIYQAELYCEECGDALATRMEAELNDASVPQDSDEFPQRVESDIESDSIDHCAAGHECKNAIDLALPDDAPLYGAESRQVGDIVTDRLTEDGRKWLIEMLSREPAPDRLPWSELLRQGSVSADGQRIQVQGGWRHAFDDITPYQAALFRAWLDRFPLEFSFGQAPEALIRGRAWAECPQGYRMTIKGQEEWKVLAEAWNQGIDSHLEGLSDRSKADASTGEVLIHPEELHVLLRRWYESEDDEAWSFRTAVLNTLGIEEI